MVNLICSTEIDGQYIDVGDLMFTPGPNDRHMARFRYDTDFVRVGYAIDPGLNLDRAPHELRGLPLAFEDAAPDAWGEVLLQRAERMQAEGQGRPSRQMTPDLFLLAASDATRQGALRFRTEQDGPFLSDDTEIPRMLDLEELLVAAEEVAADPNTENWMAIKRLLETGTSALGGARPKAALQDEAGALWLVKFPKVGDANDVPLWEMVALDIAANAGLVVPDRRLLTVGGQHVLMVRRFDRTESGERVGYISTRTLMGARELGTVADYGARGLGGRLRRMSISPKRDVERLWVQAALNLLINNTDNHLRNHGLLRDGNAWSLSPVFDLDPNPDTGTQFATHFGGAGYRGTGLQGLMGTARELGLDAETCRLRLDQVHQAVGEWETLARGYGAKETELGLFAAAFTGLNGMVRDIVTPAGSTGLR